jgi:hypothetical protein
MPEFGTVKDSIECQALFEMDVFRRYKHTQLRPSDNAEFKNEKKGAIPQCFEESPVLLGIIRRYRKYPLCRARHKG